MSENNLKEQSVVDATKPKRGFRNAKKPSKASVAKENDELRQILQALQTTDRFLGQQVMSMSQQLRHLSNENQAISSLLRLNKITDRAAVDKDTVLIDCVGQLYNEDGTLGDIFEGSYLNSAMVKLGDGNFIPGFEKELLGLTVGATAEFDITFPEDYAEELKGKKAKFTAMLLGIWENAEYDGYISDLKTKLDKVVADKLPKTEEPQTETAE